MMSERPIKPIIVPARPLPNRKCLEATTAAGKVRLVRIEGAAADLTMEADCFVVSLSLTPRRNVKGCFPRCWGPHHQVPVGDLIAIPPGEPVKLVGDGTLFSQTLVCELRPEIVEAYLGSSFEWSDRRLEAALNVSPKSIRTVLRRLTDELRSPDLASEHLLDHLVGQLAIELARYWKAIPVSPISGGLAAWRLRLIDARLQTAGTPPSLKELAELCQISVRQLTRGFRASRGVSLGHHMTDTRVGYAQKMLLDGRGVKATAFHLGFSSTSSFSCAFRREIGLSPREFVQIVKSGKPLGQVH